MEHFQQGIVESVDVQDDDGLEVQSQLLPGDDFHQFFQGAASSGEGDDAIGHFRHQLFAFVHGVGFYQAGQAGVMPALLHHETGNDTCHRTSVGESRIGGSRHQSDASGSVDEVDVLFCQDSSQFGGCLEVFRGYLCAGSTVYANVFNGVHGSFMFLGTDYTDYTDKLV